MLTIDNLEDLAISLGVTLCTHVGGKKGLWNAPRRAISIRRGLHPVAHLCTLAHEVGHAALGHDSAAVGWWRAKQELAANRWAARQLITIEEYAAAERVHPSLSGVAYEPGNVSVRHICEIPYGCLINPKEGIANIIPSKLYTST